MAGAQEGTGPDGSAARAPAPELPGLSHLCLNRFGGRGCVHVRRQAPGPAEPFSATPRVCEHPLRTLYFS